MLKVRLVVCIALTLLLVAAILGHSQEFRSMQIDSWHSGFESASATTSMVNYANSCNLNCIMPEIRLRADAYYDSNLEPPGTGVAISPAGYDSLADCITKAHALGIQVQPWVVTWRIWSTTSGPGTHYSPIDHVWWTHGPGRPQGADDWLMYSDTGAWDYGGIVNLDPGHPAVEDYLISVFMDIVNNYDVDGLNLDYIRYPATNYGYNPVSVQRFNWEYGRSGNPSSADTTWSQWRRDQISNLVKRLYLEIKAVKPQVKLSADVWNSWSSGNSSYFQDWNAWLQNHFIDFVHPMTYTGSNSQYTAWLDDAINRQNGRYVFPLVDASNDINANVLPQITDIRNHGFSGLGLYCYNSIPNRSALQTALVGGPFPSAVAVPGMPWLDTPTYGMLKGHILNSGGYAIYPATVTIQSRSTKNTGTGFYGFVDLSTGAYTVSVSAPGYLSTSGQVTINAGQVSVLDFTMDPDVTAPTISNVRAANVQGTNAQILWDTNENADSVVEYGLDTSYGQTATNPAWQTAHTVQLIALSTNTTYHYRVKSLDPGYNQTVSGDYTFTTGNSDVVADIIVDDLDAGFSLTGTWSSGSSGTEKYGTTYKYCTSAATETKTAKWTPNIMTAGAYDIWVQYPSGSTRSLIAPYTISYDGGSVVVPVNETVSCNGQFIRIAKAKPFVVGNTGYVKVGNGTNEGTRQIIADAVKFSYSDLIPPTAPTNLAGTPISGTRVDLSWTAATDNKAVTGYNVYRDGVQIGTTTTATTYSDTTCTQATTYVYEVSAHDIDNESVKSNTATVTTPDSQAPTVPTNLSATAVSETQVNLAWTASTDNVEVTGYKIFRDGVQIDTSASNSYSDTTCTVGHTYSYTVSAYDAAANESAQSDADSASTLDVTPPTVPTGLQGVAMSGTRIDLSWTASTDNVAVTSYNIYRDGVFLGSSATASYSDTTCASVHTYSYRVSACDAVPNESAQCTAVNVTTPDSIPPTAPSSLSTTVISQTQINLTWTGSTDNVGVTGYKIYRNSVYLTSVAGTSFNDTTCDSYTSYTYQVTAYDAAGNESAGSNQSTKTTLPYTDIIKDNPSASYVGAWSVGSSSTDKYGADYNYCTTAATETKTATWTPKIDVPGFYTVYCWYPAGANRSTKAPYAVVWDGGQQTINVNQTTTGGQWVALVTNKKFQSGTAGSVKVGNGTNEASLQIMADAVRFLLVSSDLTPPSVPTNLAATSVSSSQINLTWTASTDNVAVTGYKIYRDGVYLTSVTGTSYSNTGLSQYTTYSYTVLAYDAMGNESAQSTSANATTWDGIAPTVPTGLTATATSPTRVSLSWTASTDNVGVMGYKIYRGGVYVTSVATTSYVDTGRSPSTAYSYQVSAYDARNNESAKCTAVNATTPAFATIIIDNGAATYTGSWTSSTSGTDKYGTDYVYGSTATSETRTAIFRPTIAYPGNYSVYVWYAAGANRATNAPYTTYWDGGNATNNINQTTGGGAWVLVQSNRHFATGTAGYVKLSNNTGSTGKVVVADAVKYVQTSGD
jgi:uncharacterized lipoprotein YddW (UPF0748 family)/chitodextrinase